jgi:hypothetical protein
MILILMIKMPINKWYGEKYLYRLNPELEYEYLESLNLARPAETKIKINGINGNTWRGFSRF